MSQDRFKKCKSITKGKCSVFILETLPPTTESFTLHILRAHYQAAVRRSAAEPDIPNIDPSDREWTKDFTTRSLSHIQPPPNPGSKYTFGLLKIFGCSCQTDELCKTRRCFCHRNNTGCGAFCKRSEFDTGCHNHFTQILRENQDDARILTSTLEMRVEMKGFMKFVENALAFEPQLIVLFDLHIFSDFFCIYLTNVILVFHRLHCNVRHMEPLCFI